MDKWPLSMEKSQYKEEAQQNTFHLNREIKAFLVCWELPLIKLCHSMPWNQIPLLVYKGFPWHLSSAPVGAFCVLGIGRWIRSCAQEMPIKSDFWRSRAEADPCSSLSSSAAGERKKKYRWKYHHFSSFVCPWTEQGNKEQSLNTGFRQEFCDWGNIGVLGWDPWAVLSPCSITGKNRVTNSLFPTQFLDRSN